MRSCYIGTGFTFGCHAKRPASKHPQSPLIRSQRITMYRLNLLGAVALTDDFGRSCDSDVGGTKHLALLVYLVLEGARRPLRRDKVVAVLWPESGQEKARQSLSQALYKLRTALGDVVISDGQEELSLDRNLITSDCFEFAELAASGRLEEAVALYRGDVATGFNVKDAPEFDQ